MTPIVFLVGLFSAPAQAGWQATEWGMSPNEVTIATDGAAPRNSGSRGDQVIDSDMTIGNVGSYRSGDHVFESVFYFTNEQLSLVVLKVLGRQDCGFLWSDMKVAYGQPIRESDESSIHTMAWHDQEKNNRVVLAEIGASCSISYQPLHNENTAGL